MNKLEIINTIERFKPESVRVIAVDLDKTLAIGVAWNPEDIIDMPCNQVVASAVEELFLKNYIVIYTARRRELAIETMNWLDKNNIRYHAIRFEKMPATVYLDDKAINPMEII